MKVWIIICKQINFMLLIFLIFDWYIVFLFFFVWQIPRATKLSIENMKLHISW